MVMDATQPQQPSPQSVGREFVRQYYTLLNKAPNHLHRFYNNNSSFIHGESTLVVGQKNIHNRIQQLNFHDCHAKISQVDAQATLGNGVVVQVTGELSNDGQPMRRFTQTFVLAAQSPKKYYVHNDIFRYQDLYSDEEVDGEVRSENDDDPEQQQQQVPQPQVGQLVLATAPATVLQANEQPTTVVNVVNDPQTLPNQVVTGANAGTAVLNQQTQAVYYPMPTAGGRPITVLPPPPGAAPVPLAANFTNAATGVPPQAIQNPGVSQLNGVVTHDEIITNIQQPNVAQQPQLGANQTPSPVLTQATSTVPINSASVLGVQTAAGVSSIPVAVSATSVAGISQSTSSTIPNYQQSPLMPSHILQQPQQQQPQQQLPNTPSPSQLQQQNILQQSQTSLIAGSNMGDVEETISSSQMAMSSNTSPSTTEQQQQQLSRPNTAANVVASGQTISTTSTTVLEPTPAPIVEDFKTINEQQQQEKYEAAKQQQQQQNEPKTYANLFKSSSPSSFVNAAMQQQQQIQQQQQFQQQQQQSANNMYHQTNSANISSSNTYSQSAGATNSMPAYGNRNNENNNLLRQDNNSQGNSAPLPQRSNPKTFNKDFDQRRTSNSQQFGDSQQLFLGNIPHHASEDDLKALFSRFGQVVDLRILSKSGGKLPPGARNPLNYGFITYNDPEAVQNCLANCPLYFPDAPDGQKLNVEEKKTRARPSDMPPRQSMGGGSSGSGMNNMNNNQRNISGGPTSRSISNSGSGSMMRGNSVGNNANSMPRGGSSGGGSGGPPRMSGAFNRNDNRSSNGGNSGGGSQMRGGNNSQSQGNSYGVRR